MVFTLKTIANNNVLANIQLNDMKLKKTTRNKAKDTSNRIQIEKNFPTVL